MAAKKYADVEIGFRYGRLTVIQKMDRQRRQDRYKSLCDCGNTTESYAFTLKAGDAKSCGCVAAEKAKARWKNPTEEMRKVARDACGNRTHSLSKHAVYRAWSDMRSRCNKPAHKWYPSYGGRGIRVCERWESSELFIADMLPSWKPGLQLGRKDNNGNYEPSNCRWETPTENQNNKSNNVFVDTPSGRMTLAQASKHYGVSCGAIKYRLSVGKCGDALFSKSQRQST